MEVKSSFGFLVGATIGAAVEERVGEVLALNVTLHVGLGVVGKVVTNGTSGASLCRQDEIVEVLRGPQGTKLA